MTSRKVYGADPIRYLRCRGCQQAFSERKNTALWNSKLAEAKAVSVAEHLADGCGIKSTARLVKVDPSTVRRLNQKAGQHGQQYHVGCAIVMEWLYSPMGCRLIAPGSPRYLAGLTTHPATEREDHIPTLAIVSHESRRFIHFMVGDNHTGLPT